MQLGWHPLAVVQYTFTHKWYTFTRKWYTFTRKWYTFTRKWYTFTHTILLQLYIQTTLKSSLKILITKPTRCTNFSNLFWNKTLHISDSSSVHHQEFFTVHTAMVYVIQVCWQLASRIRTELVWFCCCMAYTIAVYSEKLLMMDRRTIRNI